MQPKSELNHFATVTVRAEGPSLDLYNAVRAAFVIRNTTLHAWCVTAKVNPQNAVLALTGAWNGAKGQAMRTRIIKASGIEVRP